MKNLWRNLYVASRIKLFSMFGVVAESFLRCPGPIPPRFGRTAWGPKFQQEIRRQKKKEEKLVRCQQNYIPKKMVGQKQQSCDHLVICCIFIVIGWALSKIIYTSSEDDTQSKQRGFANAATNREPVSHFLFWLDHSSSHVLAHGGSPYTGPAAAEENEPRRIRLLGPVVLNTER